MGYLNNSSRVLDAILTKKGREILSTGGNFTVTQFALGDDEIDYGLWDTTHTQGTDFYGAVIDNLPTLEPFNDPSEIMKYKLVTRDEGTEAMAKLEVVPGAGHIAALTSRFWYDTADVNNRRNVVTQNGTDTGKKLGAGTRFGIQHIDNAEFTTHHADYVDELFTLTLLDSAVAVLAPTQAQPPNPNTNPIISSADQEMQHLWLPAVKSPQHFSQTIPNCKLSGGVFRHENNSFNGFPEAAGALSLYPKRISETSSPAKTSIIITGQESGAVFEYDVTVTWDQGSG
jgi:hypothetical protein